ncbi:MAG: endonuclease/exonuclease/phosphatase family protein [Pseudomonadota bacterium]|nr:endonuclease/exonuclease/phosphatase family protein [Pseudomonadota bacterium]
MSNNYAGMRQAFGGDTMARRRCAERLRAMRASLAPLHARRSPTSLLLATWNIRDFDSNKFGYGPRLTESFYYLAEIAGCFDLIALQEVNRDLAALERLVRILGRQWDYIVTDATEGAGGNGERMAFLFRSDKVWFRKIAGEVVLPDGQLVVSPKAVKPPKDKEATTSVDIEDARQQFARTPFLVAFQSGWFRFSLCTVHIYYGRDSGAKLKRRIAEIERLVQFFANRQDREAKDAASGAQAENYILLGDFNVVSPEHQTMTALQSHGFTVPDAISGRKVRADGDHFYDQIAVRVLDPRFRVVTGGIVDMYADVFRDTEEDRSIYAPLMPAEAPEEEGEKKATQEGLYRKWRTWQMSDHAPLWVEIETDFTDDYLERLAEAEE